MSTINVDHYKDDQLSGINEQERERRAGMGGWSMSLIIHGSVLLLLALVVVIRPPIEEITPIRTAYIQPQAFTPPIDKPLIEPEVTVDIEVTVEVESAAADVASFEVSEVELISEDLSAVSENVTTRAMAVGAGSSGGGSGGNGLFLPGGGMDGHGTGGFFGIGDKGGAAAQRILYIIDMSRSLKEPQISLIKDRLLNSMADLTGRQHYEVLFYSGPVWQLGDDPSTASNRWVKGRNHHDYTPPAAPPEGQWRQYPPSVRAEIESYVMNELYTTVGTDWRHPFQIAFQMDPLPEVIYFLTDGKVDNSEETIQLIENQSQGGEGEIPQINTIAFGLEDQDGVGSLKTMSEMTYGEHIGYTMAEIDELYQLLLKEGQRR